jgi:signal transduction histidine kinase
MCLLYLVWRGVDPSMSFQLFTGTAGYFSERSKPFLIILGFILVLLVGVADYFTGTELSVSIFYLFPIVLATWSLNKGAGVFFAVFSSVVELLTDLTAGHHYSHPIIVYWNNAVHFGFYFIIVFILSILKKEYEKTVQLNIDLQTTLIELHRTKEEVEQKANDLVRSNEELEQFANMAAHDLKEPLVVVGGYINRLKRLFANKNDREVESIIGRSLDGIGRMEALINSILAYARVGTKGKEFKLIDCNDIMKSAVSNLRAKIQESGVIITYDSLPTFIADEIQLTQLFQNLILNGIKFRGEELPRIHVSIGREDKGWVFGIHDNGIGIKAEHKASIFDVFKRIHDESKYPGNGIGLAICKKVVENHGGRIWVESCPGEGSTFKFTIPIEDTNLT